MATMTRVPTSVQRQRLSPHRKILPMRNPRVSLCFVRARLRSLPRIDDRRAGAFVIARVAGDNGQAVARAVAAMMRSGCENVCPALRPSSTSSRHLNITSSLTGRRALEHRPHFVRRANREFGALSGVGDEFDAEADFGEGHGADVEMFEWFAATKASTLGSGLGRRSSERMFVSSSQPVTNRPRAPAWVRAWFDVDVAVGEACIAAISAARFVRP